MGKVFKVFFVLIIIALIAIQFVEVNRTNPPVTGDLKALPQVKEILKTSCYDCHSNETKWPWYSYVAPVSWLIETDVNDGRKHLNFSGWEKLNSSKQAELKKEIWTVIRDDQMPMGLYTIMHPASKLDITQKNIIKQWTTGNGFWN
ncbi:MAG: heme-binding domain-containing protein [Bacteroidota bacterium]|jgi:hypothetical protein